MRHELDPPFSFYPHQRGKLDSQYYTLVFKGFYNWTLGFQDSLSYKKRRKTIPNTLFTQALKQSVTLFTQAFKHTDEGHEQGNNDAADDSP
jgi:hypothetical protein